MFMPSDTPAGPILPRAVAPLLGTTLRTMRVIVIAGPRQAGKSTLVRFHPLLVSRPCFCLDDTATLLQARADRGAFVRSAPAMTIDEIQRDLDLTLAVKSVVDEERAHRPGQFVLTGSANLSTMRAVSDCLAGRAYYLRLQPLTRREQQGLGCAGSWGRFFETPVERWLQMVQEETPAPERWQDAVHRGGFPGALEQQDSAGRSAWFERYRLGYLEQDLGQLKAVSDLPRFQALMRSAARRIGNLVNHAELARDVKMPQTTVHEHLRLLETTFQAVRLAPFARSVKRRLIRTPKLYWSDTGLALHVASSEPSGAHLENYVLCDLLAWRDTEVPRPEISYWRTASGAEVDFVIERKRELLAIQVQSTPAMQPRHAAHIASFQGEHGAVVRGGLVLHPGEETCWLRERILAVPWWRVM